MLATAPCAVVRRRERPPPRRSRSTARDDDLVVRTVDEGEQRRGQRLGGTGRHDHLCGGVDLEPVEAPLVFADRGEQVGVPSSGRVLVHPAGDRVPGSVEHLCRTVLVGEALAEIDRTGSGRSSGHLCEDGGRDGSVWCEQAGSRCRAPPCAGDDTHEEQAKAIGETHLRHTKRTDTGVTLRGRC